MMSSLRHNDVSKRMTDCRKQLSGESVAAAGDGDGEVCSSQRALDAVADALGLRDSELGTILDAVLSLEDKLNSTPDCATLNRRAAALEQLAERLEAEAVDEPALEKKLAEQIEQQKQQRQRAKAHNSRATTTTTAEGQECSWDGAGEDTMLDDLSCLVAGEEEEEDRDEFTHRKVCMLADTSRQLDARQKELMSSGVAVREEDVSTLLPLVNALVPAPETATPDERAAIEAREDARLGELLEQAINSATLLLQEATEELEDAVGRM